MNDRELQLKSKQVVVDDRKGGNEEEGLTTIEYCQQEEGKFGRSFNVTIGVVSFSAFQTKADCLRVSVNFYSMILQDDFLIEKVQPFGEVFLLMLKKRMWKVHSLCFGLTHIMKY